MAQVAVALKAPDLHPLHAVAEIGLLPHIFFFYRAGEAGPAGAGVELVQRGEERLAGDHIHIDARLLVVPELVVEGGLGAALLGHMKLEGGELLFEIFFGVFCCQFDTSLRIFLFRLGLDAT